MWVALFLYFLLYPVYEKIYSEDWENLLNVNAPDLVPDYRKIYSKDNFYWEIVEIEIIDFCKTQEPPL